MITPEARFVLATAGDPAHPRLAALARADLDWRRVLRLAAFERAEPAVHAALMAHAPDRVPADALAALAAAARGARVRLAYMHHRLDETLAAFAEAGIPVVLLKGAALARTAYPSVGDRPMSDLDLLVRPADAARAYEVAQGAGWRTSEYVALESFYAEHVHLPPLRDGRAADVALELHVGLLPAGHPYRFGPDDVWADAEARGDALVPSARHLALHLCAHFAWSHVLSQGAWVAFRDLRMLAHTGAIDGERFAMAAGRIGMRSACYWTLRLARTLAAVPVPEEVEAALRPRRIRWAMRVLERHLHALLDPLEEHCPSIALQRRLWYQAMRDDVEGRVVTPPWARDPLFAFEPGLPPRPERRRRHLRRLAHRAVLYQRYLWNLLRPAAVDP